jgi:hypothetical protein
MLFLTSLTEKIARQLVKMDMLFIFLLCFGVDVM